MAEDDDKDWPNWAKSIKNWLAVATGLIVAVGLLLAALGKGKEAWCSLVSCDQPKPNPTGAPSVAPAPPKANCPTSLPAYDSPEMGGGHNQEEICGPNRQTYEQQYPGCAVSMAVSESNNKDFLGHVTYKYYCTYAMNPK
jgi:hypothetical protein